MRVKELLYFIRERHAIYVRRVLQKQARPWTKDCILQDYRFCNVYRELDAVTIWIRKNWRAPFKHDPNIWFAMVVARLVNWPDSLRELATAIHNGDHLEWNPKDFVRELEARQKRGVKTFSGAYMINAVGGEGRSKADYLADRVLNPVWARREEGYAAFNHTSLAEAHHWLSQFRGMGSFMAAQVVCDVKYTPLLAKAHDWWDWAAPGPGSLRGMSRLEFGDVHTAYPGEQWHTALSALQSRVDPTIAKIGMPRLHAQDLQNCLCEFDKYERVRLGEGKPRSKYDGKGA